MTSKNISKKGKIFVGIFLSMILILSIIAFKNSQVIYSPNQEKEIKVTTYDDRLEAAIFISISDENKEKFQIELIDKTGKTVEPTEILGKYTFNYLYLLSGEKYILKIKNRTDKTLKFSSPPVTISKG